MGSYNSRLSLFYIIVSNNQSIIATIANITQPFIKDRKCFFGLEYNSDLFSVPVNLTLLEFLHHNISITFPSLF